MYTNTLAVRHIILCNVSSDVEMWKKRLRSRRSRNMKQGLCAGRCKSVTWLNLSHNYISSMTFVSQLSRLTGMDYGVVISKHFIFNLHFLSPPSDPQWSSASDSTSWFWRFINLLTYLLTYLQFWWSLICHRLWWKMLFSILTALCVFLVSVLHL